MRTKLAALLALAAIVSQLAQSLLGVELQRQRPPAAASACADRLLAIYSRNASIDSPPRLKGYWVSSGCEIRPGPEFLVRKYHFVNDTYFRVLQFYFADSACTDPRYGLEAKGAIRLAGNTMATDLLTARPTELLKPPMLFQVSVMPYTSATAQELQQRVSSASVECSAKFSGQSWASGVGPFDILSYVEYNRRIMQDYDCTKPLGFNLNELQLLRVERERRDGREIKQLFLGDIATSFAKRHRHRPTSYQTPLQDINNADCQWCYSSLHASLRRPPQMPLRAVLTTYPAGEWVSATCESRPGDNFVTRHLAFDADNRTWRGSYHHFHDPLCWRPFFSFTASGSVVPRGLVGDSQLPAQKFDFVVTGLSITPRDSKSVQQLNAYSGFGCGRGHWLENRTQDVTDTGGCEHLQLHVPTVSRQVMYQELRDASVWLSVGAIANVYPPRTQRPTSFQPPLLRCSDRRRLAAASQQQRAEDGNEAGPRAGAGRADRAVSAAAAGGQRGASCWTVASALLLLLLLPLPLPLPLVATSAKRHL